MDRAFSPRIYHLRTKTLAAGQGWYDAGPVALPEHPFPRSPAHSTGWRKTVNTQPQGVPPFASIGVHLRFSPSRLMFPPDRPIIPVRVSFANCFR